MHPASAPARCVARASCPGAHRRFVCIVLPLARRGLRDAIRLLLQRFCQFDGGTGRKSSCAVDAQRTRTCPLASLRLMRRSALTTLFCRTLRYRSEEHTSELQSLIRSSDAVFFLKKHTLTHP